ncbi:hypothetical protein ACFPN0_00725 [Kitasatospora cinereorecta]
MPVVTARHKKSSWPNVPSARRRRRLHLPARNDEVLIVMPDGGRAGYCVDRWDRGSADTRAWPYRELK